jgi:hypothetical protein
VWEWRAFASRFDALDAPVVEEREDLYVLAPRLDVTRGLKVRGGDTVELKLVDRTDGELELWKKTFVSGLEMPPWRTRELARAIRAEGALVPVRPVRTIAELEKLLQDVGLGAARTIAIHKRTRELVLDAVRLERTELRVGGAELVTFAVEGVDPEVVRSFASRVRRVDDAFVGSYPAWLARR